MLDILKDTKVLLAVGIFAVLSFIVGPMVCTNPLQLILLLFGAVAVGVCLFSRWGGALILIGLAPFYGFIRFVLEISPAMVLIKEAIVALILISWLAEDIVLKKRIELPQNPVLMPLGLFLFILVVQFLRTGTPVQSLFGLRVYITYIPLFYIMLTEKITDRRLKTVLFVMIITAMLTVAYGFWQWSLGLEGLRDFDLAKAGPNIAAGGNLRVFSTYPGPEYFAANLILQILVLIGLISSSRNIAGKVTYFVCICLMMFMLVTTLYRSMWVMALVSFTAILAIIRKYRYAILMVLAIFLVLQYSPSYVKERAGFTFSKEDESYQIRKELYFKTNVINVLDNIIGYGVGSSLGSETFTLRTGRRYSGSLLTGGMTESWLTSVTIELGVLGFLVYLWLMVAIIKTSLYVYRESSDLFWRGLGLAFSAFVIGDLVVSSFFQVPACFPAGDLYFWFLTGLMANKYYELVYENPLEAQLVQ